VKFAAVPTAGINMCEQYLLINHRTVITKHINDIFKEHELEEKLVCANFAHTTHQLLIGALC
jgi:hypothetical protein